MAVAAYLSNEFMPFLKEWASQLEQKRQMPESERMLAPSSCIMHLTDRCGQGQESLLDLLKGLDSFLSTLTEKILGPEIPAAEVSALVRTWDVKSKATAHACVAALGKLEQTDAVKGLQESLKTALSDTGSVLSIALKKEIERDAWTSVKACVQTLVNVASADHESGIDIDKAAALDLVDSGFFGHVESGKLYSTALEDKGKVIRDGLDFIALMVNAAVADSKKQMLEKSTEADVDSLEATTVLLIKSSIQLHAYKNQTLVDLNEIVGNVWSPAFWNNLTSCRR